MRNFVWSTAKKWRLKRQPALFAHFSGAFSPPPAIMLSLTYRPLINTYHGLPARDTTARMAVVLRGMNPSLRKGGMNY